MAEQRPQLTDERRLGLLVPAERGAEQHEGLEMGLLDGVVELQVVENAIGVEALLVLAARLVGITAEDGAAQDAEQFALHALDEIRLEQLVSLSAEDVDVGVGTLVELEGELVVEDGDA